MDRILEIRRSRTKRRKELYFLGKKQPLAYYVTLVWNMDQGVDKYYSISKKIQDHAFNTFKHSFPKIIEFLENRYKIKPELKFKVHYYIFTNAKSEIYVKFKHRYQAKKFIKEFKKDKTLLKIFSSRYCYSKIPNYSNKKFSSLPPIWGKYYLMQNNDMKNHVRRRLIRTLFPHEVNLDDIKWKDSEFYKWIDDSCDWPFFVDNNKKAYFRTKDDAAICEQMKPAAKLMQEFEI